MRDLLRTGRWLGFTAAAVAAIVAFGLLSLWQWHRAEEKREQFSPVSVALNTAPVDAATIEQPTEWQHVTATGTFDADQQLAVRNRPQSGSNGFWVVALFDTEPKDLWVVRGFLPVAGAATTTVPVPPPPSDEVTVTGYARPAEAEPARPAEDLPAGQVAAVNTADLDSLAGSATSDWYLLAASDPALLAVPLPEPTDSRNLSYAGQWLLFAAITIAGWFYFLRREAQDVAATASTADDPVDVRS